MKLDKKHFRVSLIINAVAIFLMFPFLGRAPEGALIAFIFMIPIVIGVLLATITHSFVIPDIYQLAI